jgi:hypothetical protein
MNSHISKKSKDSKILAWIFQKLTKLPNQGQTLKIWWIVIIKLNYLNLKLSKIIQSLVSKCKIKIVSLQKVQLRMLDNFLNLHNLKYLYRILIFWVKTIKNKMMIPLSKSRIIIKTNIIHSWRKLISKMSFKK